MGIEKLERTLWRIRKNNPQKNRISNQELKKAIMYECGTDPKTYTSNRKALLTLQWIKSDGTKHIKLTDKDINESH